MIFPWLFALLLGCPGAEASGRHEILTNAVHMASAPEWLNSTRINKVVDQIQSFLEWDIHRVEATWYDNPASFEAVHHLGSTVMAFSRKADHTIHLGPKVNSTNFDAIFGHELVHVIISQKYKMAIPPWLEEGLANHLSHDGNVNYQWLAGKGIPRDVRQLTHPFSGTDDDVRFHYQSSQALVEMMAARCDLRNLLRLSVGRKLEDYLPNICRIDDLNLEYHKWIKSKAPTTESTTKVQEQGAAK